MIRLAHQLFSWLRTPRALRWLALGVAAAGCNFALLYLMVDGLGIPFLIAPVISAEFGIVLRFLGNDRWVFGHARSAWQRLGQYHEAVAGGFVVWWAISNILVLDGVHYLTAAMLAICGSIGFNLVKDFGWIWRKHHTAV
jgi:putative flippase GtrA